MSSTQQPGGDPGRLSGSLGLDMGPPLSSRQKKAAAAFTLAQLLALGELRATARRKQASGRSRSTVPLAGCPATATRPYAGLAAVSRLQQSVAKRRAEEEVDAAATASTRQHPAGAGSAQTAVSMKRIAIVPPPGTQIPAARLGCHLARRCGGSGRGGGGGGSVGPSSLARVYGSRLRVGQLPDDYSECFMGLEPVQQTDVDEQGPYSSSADAPRLTPVGDPGQGAPNGGVGGVGGLTAPPTGGALLGSISVGEEMSFLFAANASVPPIGAPVVLLNPGALPHPSGAPSQALAGAGAAAGGLMAPFATSAAPTLAGASMPYTVVQTYGGPRVAGFPGDAAAPAAAAAATAAAPDLMLDADESSSSELGDEIGASGGVWGSERQPMLSQPRPGDSYGVGLSGLGPGGGAYSGFGSGMGLATAAGTGTGLFNGSGAGGGMGPGAAAVDDDGEMVEEF